MKRNSTSIREDILNEEKLIELGWQAVPANDGSKFSTWDDINTEMKSFGLSLFIS